MLKYQSIKVFFTNLELYGQKGVHLYAAFQQHSAEYIRIKEPSCSHTFKDCKNRTCKVTSQLILHFFTRLVNLADLENQEMQHGQWYHVMQLLTYKQIILYRIKMILYILAIEFKQCNLDQFFRCACKCSGGSRNFKTECGSRRGPEDCLEAYWHIPYVFVVRVKDKMHIVIMVCWLLLKYMRAIR